MSEHTVNGRKIHTDYWQKPIPPREYDWSATFDGYEGGDKIGYGPTEDAAIADLIEQANEATGD